MDPFPLRRRGGQRGAEKVPGHPLEHLCLLRAVRRDRRLRSLQVRPENVQALVDGQVGALKTQYDREKSGRDARRIQHYGQRARHSGLRGRALQLVCAPRPRALLGERDDAGQGGGIHHALHRAHNARQSACALHALHGGDDVSKSRARVLSRSACLRAPLRLPRGGREPHRSRAREGHGGRAGNRGAGQSGAQRGEPEKPSAARRNAGGKRRARPARRRAYGGRARRAQRQIHALCGGRRVPCEVRLKAAAAHARSQVRQAAQGNHAVPFGVRRRAGRLRRQKWRQLYHPARPARRAARGGFANRRSVAGGVFRGDGRRPHRGARYAPHRRAAGRGLRARARLQDPDHAQGGGL